MVVFLLDEFNVLVSTFSIRSLKATEWSKKAARQVARGFYLYNLTEFHSYHLVFVDESNKRIRFRRTGWSPYGVAPVQVA